MLCVIWVIFDHSMLLTHSLFSVKQMPQTLYQHTVWSASHLLSSEENTLKNIVDIYGLYTQTSEWLNRHTAVSSVSSGTPWGSAVLAVLVMLGLSLSRRDSWMTPVCSGSSTLSSSVTCDGGARGWVPPALSSKCRRSALVIQPASFWTGKLCEHSSNCIVSQEHGVRYYSSDRCDHGRDRQGKCGTQVLTNHYVIEYCRGHRGQKSC